jgi:hypothetical protein
MLGRHIEPPISSTLISDRLFQRRMFCRSTYSRVYWFKFEKMNSKYVPNESLAYSIIKRMPTRIQMRIRVHKWVSHAQ